MSVPEKETASAADKPEAKDSVQAETPAVDKSSGPAGDEHPVFYGTQVLVSSKTMTGKDPFFKGYDVKVVKAGRLFKYIIGCSADLDTAKELSRKIRRDFKDSFLVKVENETTEIVR